MRHTFQSKISWMSSSNMPQSNKPISLEVCGDESFDEKNSEPCLEVVPYSSSAALSVALWNQQQQENRDLNSNLNAQKGNGNGEKVKTSKNSNISPGERSTVTWNAYSIHDGTIPRQSPRNKLFFWKNRKSRQIPDPTFSDSDIDSDNEIDHARSNSDNGKSDNTRHKKSLQIDSNENNVTSEKSTRKKEKEKKKKSESKHEGKKYDYLDDESNSTLDDILGKQEFDSYSNDNIVGDEFENLTLSKEMTPNSALTRTICNTTNLREEHHNKSGGKSDIVENDNKLPTEMVVTSNKKKNRKFTGLKKMFRNKNKANQVKQKANAEDESSNIVTPNTEEMFNDTTREKSDQTGKTFDIKPEAIILDLMDMKNDNSDDEEVDRYMNFEEHEWLKSQATSQSENVPPHNPGDPSPDISHNTLNLPPNIIRSVAAGEFEEASCFTSLSESFANFDSNPHFNETQPRRFSDKDHELKLMQAQMWKAARRRHIMKFSKTNPSAASTVASSVNDPDCVLFNDAYEAMKFAMQYDDNIPVIRRNSTKTTKIMSNRLEDSESIETSSQLWESAQSFPSRTEYNTKDLETSALTDSFMTFDTRNKIDEEDEEIKSKDDNVENEIRNDEVDITSNMNTSSSESQDANSLTVDGMNAKQASHDSQTETNVNFPRTKSDDESQGDNISLTSSISYNINKNGHTEVELTITNSRISPIQEDDEFTRESKH